jgi:hypothetical protein
MGSGFRAAGIGAAASAPWRSAARLGGAAPIPGAAGAIYVEPHLAQRCFLWGAAPDAAKEIPHDETRVCADYCGRGRCSPGSGTTATPARAAGPGQRQLGPPAGHQAKHPAPTSAERAWRVGGPAKMPGVIRGAACRARNLIRMQYRSATPEFVGRVRTFGCNARPQTRLSAAQPELELVSLHESNQPPEFYRQMRVSAAPVTSDAY